MPIFYDESRHTFRLQSKSAEYAIYITPSGYILHLYFGKSLPDADLTFLADTSVGDNFNVASVETGGGRGLDSTPMEYPTSGLGDYREPCISVMDKHGMSACALYYRGYRIYKGKDRLPGLPSTYANHDDEVTSLEIYAEDPVLKLSFTLRYSVFEGLDAVTRSVSVKNNDTDKIELRRILSACLELPGMDYDLISLNGNWARERHVERMPLRHGKQIFDSFKGVTSNENNNFIALCDRGADEEHGNAYGICLMYSGNYMTGVDCYHNEAARVFTGINPYDFSWTLEKDEEFYSPEAILVYSHDGIGGMSRTFHDLIRNNIIRGKYKHARRPVLINNWEATYFNFNTEKLLSIARSAADAGIEMLVMDDGWFGHRDGDNSSLGDWFVYEKKLDGGLKHLVDEVNRLGMKFGIWVEPEMVSPDSELYRAHPDWCLHIPGRNRSTGRNQLVLDFSRKEVRDFIYAELHAVLSSANIEYVKWDNNRSICDMGNEVLKPSRQREIWHRQVLGMYEMQERLVTDFPDILLENCSGGGARFDCGMLYYSPQIWLSDNTDAVERLKIQHGTSLCYPVSSFGAHVSDCPNHCLGRNTPFSTRADVALCGSFGYELDVTRISDADRGQIRSQVDEFHKYTDLIREGDFYRLGDPFTSDKYTAWEIVAKDGSEVLMTYVKILNDCNFPQPLIHMAGLDTDAIYVNEADGREFSGALLMYVGYPVPYLHGDFASTKIHLIKKLQT